MAALERAADFDGDGRGDLIGAGHVGNLVSFRRNLGGYFTEPVEYNCGTTSNESIVVDYDKDGDLDFVIAYWGNFQICKLENDEKGSFTPQTILCGLRIRRYSCRGSRW